MVAFSAFRCEWPRRGVVHNFPEMKNTLLLAPLTFGKNYLLSPKSNQDSPAVMESLIQTIESRNGKVIRRFAFISSYLVSLPSGFDLSLLKGVNVEEDRELTIQKIQ